MGVTLPTSIPTKTSYTEAEHRAHHEQIHGMYNVLFGDYAFATDIYVDDTNGNDANDGLAAGAGRAFKTITKAYGVLPLWGLITAVTIHVADGTYNQAIKLTKIVNDRDTMLTIVGNTGAPNNVDFTGTVTAIRDDDWSGSTVVLVEGNCYVTLSGIRASIPNGGEQQIAVRHGAWVKLDRCNGRAATGTCNDGITCADRATIEIKGNCTFTGWTRWGWDISHTSKGRFTSAGTLTLTGPGGGSTTAIGVHVFEHSAFISYTASCHITVTGTQFAFQCGLNSEFQHQGATHTLTATNTTTPTGSAIVQCTDHSTFSSQGTITADKFTNRFWVNSISYAEHSTYGGAAQGRNITNTGGDNGSQQSAILIDSTNTNYPV